MPNQPFLNDWVRETSTIVGTGDITLLGAVATFRAFASLYTTGDTFFYTAKHRTLLEAESGIGQLTASGTIARTSVLESTNANALVAFSAGTKDVFIAPVSRMFPTLATNQIWVGVTGSVPVATSSPTFDSLIIVSQSISSIPLTIKGFAGQTANLTQWQDSTNTVLLSVQPGGELRGNATNGLISLQEGLTGVTIFSANVTNAVSWVDSITGYTRIRLGNTTPTNANMVHIGATGGGLLTRFAITSNSVQVSPRFSNVLPVPLGSTAFEVLPLTAGIGVALRAQASQTGNLLNTYDSANVIMSYIGPNAEIFINAKGITTKPLVIKGIAGITANLTEWQDNTGAVLASVGATGSVFVTVNATASKLLVLKAMASQTGNFIECQDSGGIDLADITASGNVRACDGTTTTPGLTFRTDPDLGFYRAGNNKLSLVTNAGVTVFSHENTLPYDFRITYGVRVGTGITTGTVSWGASKEVYIDGNNNKLQFATNPAAALGIVRVEITGAGSVVLAKSGALATNATDGFTYLPSCPGKPTGVPTAQTGNVPIVVDSTGNQNFIYSGGEWVCVGPITSVLVFRGAPSVPGPPETVGANKGAEITMPFAGKILRARARAKVGPTGADLIFDLNLNGTSIWNTTPANRLRIVAGATTGSQTNFDTVNFVDGDVATIDVDQIGSGTAGADLTIQLEVRKTG